MRNDVLKQFPHADDACTAILHVGSRAQRSHDLVDDYSDDDFLVLRRGYEPVSGRIFRLASNTHAHYGILSMKALDTLGESSYVIPIRISPWIYLTTNYLESFTEPVYATSCFTDWVHSVNLDALQRICAFKYIQAHRAVIHTIHTHSNLHATGKCMHHLIRAYCLVQQDFTDYDPGRLLRIKRAGVQQLSADDCRYVKTYMELMMEYTHLDFDTWKFREKLTVKK